MKDNLVELLKSIVYIPPAIERELDEQSVSRERHYAGITENT